MSGGLGAGRWKPPIAVLYAIPEGAPLHGVGGLVQANIVALRSTWQVVVARRLLRAAG